MFTVLECVLILHDRSTVALAAVIALGGLLAFFLLLTRAEECEASRRNTWRLVAACAGGLAIWATHFVAMLAYRGPMPIEYGLALTFVSAAVVVVGFWLAVQVLGLRSRFGVLLAALLATTAIAAMHFIGMEAIRVAARVRYDWSPILVGTLACVTLLAGAFSLFSRLKGALRIAAPASLAVLAICALHFTGMSATELAPDPSLAGPSAHSGGRIWLIAAVALASALVIAITALAVVIDRYLTDLKGFADATLEGLAVVRDGRIVEANVRFRDLMEMPEGRLIGLSADACLIASDGRPVSQERAKPVEATPRFGAAGRVFEVGVHTIEYRGRACEVLAVRDLTERQAAQRRIEYLARHDGLTDLPNRTLFEDRLDHALAGARRSGESVAVLALDLDRFKAVNDLFGHAEGDRVLKDVAAMLKRCVRESDTVARIGGDEFVILQMGGARHQGARVLVERILDAFRVEMNPARDPTAVGVSIGVALYPDDAADSSALRQAADVALYRAKEAGRGNAAFYDLDMDRETRERREMEGELRHAAARRQLHVVYQPLMANGVCTGYEALLRWLHPRLGEISPEIFIPMAEETGAILSIGEWILRRACRDAMGWDAGLSIAVNVSPVQFRLATLADTVLAILSETGLEPGRLELEVTERALVNERLHTLETLHRLKAAGVKVVMDDFGTGYSSLGNLRAFPFDKLKIDRSFIGSMAQDEGALAIVRAVVGLGRSLSLPVVAEGVETVEQLRMASEEGCALAQGFLFGPPGPVDAGSRSGPGVKGSESRAIAALAG